MQAVTGAEVPVVVMVVLVSARLRLHLEKQPCLVLPGLVVLVAVWECVRLSST